MSSMTSILGFVKMESCSFLKKVSLASMQNTFFIINLYENTS